MVKRFLLIGFMLIACNARVHAEENGVGHWIPGQIPFFAGMMPPDKGLYVRESNYMYSGTLSDKIGVPIGNEVVFNSKRVIYVDTFIFNYVFAPKRAGWVPNVSMDVAIPFMYFKNSVTLTPTSFAESQSSYNLSDVIITPINLGWDFQQYHWTAGINVYAPTGPYSVNSLVPSGYNYWTFEPAIGFTYYDPGNRIELTFYAGIDFNTINYAAEYKTGDQFHVDWIAAKYFNHGFAMGLGGYVYDQVTGDSGTGAVLGAYKDYIFSLGPVFRYADEIMKVPLSIELKVLPRIRAVNAPDGTAAWLNFNLTFK
ncbi:MAG: transporter [Gammaproteobacteria bacterium]